MQDTSLPGVPGDSRDGVGDTPPRVVVANFHGPTYEMPVLRDGPPVPVVAYFDGTDRFAVQFGTPGNGQSTQVWTDEDGIVAVIKACQATLDRARTEIRSAAIEASES